MHAACQYITWLVLATYLHSSHALSGLCADTLCWATHALNFASLAFQLTISKLFFLLLSTQPLLSSYFFLNYLANTFHCFSPFHICTTHNIPVVGITDEVFQLRTSTYEVKWKVNWGLLRPLFNAIFLISLLPEANAICSDRISKRFLGAGSWQITGGSWLPVMVFEIDRDIWLPKLLYRNRCNIFKTSWYS